MEDNGHEENTQCRGGSAGQRGTGGERKYNNDKQISGHGAHRLVSGVPFHLVMSKDLASHSAKGREIAPMCVCMCGFFARAFLIYWPTDLLMCAGLHAAQSTSLEHPGLASLGAHALKLLTFPNLFPSLLIVVKNWTRPPTLRSCVEDLDFDGISLVSECHLPRCLDVECKTSTVSDEGNETGLFVVLICRTKIITQNK